MRVRVRARLRLRLGLRGSCFLALGSWLLALGSRLLAIGSWGSWLTKQIVVRFLVCMWLRKDFVCLCLFVSCEIGFGDRPPFTCRNTVGSAS